MVRAGIRAVRPAAKIAGFRMSLDNILRTREITAGDVRRFALNELRIALVDLTQSAPFDALEISDVLAAAWVAGDISAAAFRECIQQEAFGESHPAWWKKVLKVAFEIGQGTLMAFPTTSYAAIAVRIGMEIHDQGKTNGPKKAQKTHAIPSIQ